MGKEKKTIFIVILLVLTLLSLPAYSCFAAQKVLKVGDFNPMTGPGAFWGTSAKKSLDLAAENWNRRGGVTVKGQKYKIEFIHYDDKYKGEEAVRVVNQLIFTDRVKFIVGPLASACVLAAQPIIEANKVILICNTFAGKELLQNKPYTFRVMAPPLHASPAFFTWLRREHPELNSCVHISPNSATGWGSTQGDNDSCAHLGINVLGSEFFEPGTEDFTPILVKVLAKKPDFLSIAGTPGSSAGLLIKQARELGFEGRIIHTGHLDPDDVGDIAGWKNIEGILTSTPAFEGPLVPQKAKDLSAQFIAKYGKEGAAFAMLFYDYLNVLCWGIEKADSLDTEKVRVGIESLDPVHTILGEGYWGGKKFYGQNHQLIWPYMFTEIRNGKTEVVGFEMPWEMPVPQKKWR